MSKYNFAVDSINTNSTHGKILSQIKEGSTVLECGCATGYMTRFMKEKMGCHVSIVEIDEEAYNIARESAEDGFCGNLDEHYWAEHFKKGKFDYIMFADVLEHLRIPERTLSFAKGLLKKDGKVIFSIPNICHNDILIRMFYDNFTYTKFGLLDNTHIHFFGGNNLPDFCNKAGFELETVEVLMARTGETEQRCDLNEIDEELLTLLKKRKLGEVYQYIVTCVPKG